MNLDTYDLPEEEFKHLFQGSCDLFCQLFKQHLITLDAFNVPDICLNDPKFIWNSFSEVLYAASDNARLIQKENNPEAINKRRYSYEFGTPVEVIKELH